MKILKKVIYLFSLLLLVPLITFALPKQNASAADEVKELEIFKYITISQQGQMIKTANIKTIDNSAYIIANGTVTISINPIAYNYYFENSLDSSNYYPITWSTTLTKDGSTGSYPLSFVYNNTTYYYRTINESHILNIYNSDPSGSITLAPTVTTQLSSVISYTDNNDNETRTITLITGYAYKNLSDTSDFRFAIRTSSSTRNYSINFSKPVVKFANAENPIVRFTCDGLDAGDGVYIENTIRREQVYLNVQIDFLNNNYTETNPLFFDINYNGFIYTFELYSKEYNSSEYLFVNYIDTEKESNNKYLASALISDGADGFVLDTSTAISKLNGTDFNLFSLLFNQTGRYDIKIYDSTYVYGLNNANFYNTSFYIKDKTVTAFENIYIISQTYDDENNPIEYIVSTSTLNYNVLTTIKNLKNLGVGADGNPILLENVIDKIEVRKTTFGGSSNIPTKTTYSVEDVKKQLETSDDFTLLFTDDAYYEVTIYKKDSSSYIYYEYTIVKHAKTTFSVPQVDENGQPIFENGKQKLDTYEASKPYKTEIINYDKNILSTMTLVTKFSIDDSAIRSQLLDKTFINRYTISYGMEQVSIEKIEIEVSDDEKKTEDKLDLQFKGVGTLIVRVTFNNQTTEYELNYEKGNSTLTFTEYGTYHVYLVDSMGTSQSATFSLDKKLNFSAILLIVLSCIIVAVIALFVIRARGKVATR